MTSTQTIKLAHLSDLHLTAVSGFYPRHWNIKRGLGYLNWHVGGRRRRHDPSVAAMLVEDMRAQSPDHVAVTGDLANIGLPGELAAAAAWLEGLGPPEQVTAIPGNHDIYVRFASDIGVERWRDYMRGNDAGRKFETPGRAGFPFVRIVGPVALIGLNSAVPTPPFNAAGELGGLQLAALEHILNVTKLAGLVRVVLIHHPPLPGLASKLRGLRDAEALVRVLEAAGCELVLHGHNHRDSLAWGDTACGRFPVVGIASGSVAKPHGKDALARYNMFTIGNDGNEVGIEMVGRGLNEPGGHVIELERQVFTVTIGHDATEQAID